MNAVLFKRCLKKLAERGKAGEGEREGDFYKTKLTRHASVEEAALPFEKKVSWFVAAKPSTWKKQLAIGEAIEGKAGEAIKGMVAVKRQLEHAKASARCAIEWSFHWIKNIYGYSKTRYHGIAKNHSRTVMLCSLYKEALQKYPEQSFAQKFSLCNRQKFSWRKIIEGF